MWALIGVGALAVSAVVFWSAVQHWLAGLIVQARDRFGVQAEVLQSALVIFDRVVVGSQRLVQAVLRLNVRPGAVVQPVTLEDRRVMQPTELPSSIRQRVEAGQSAAYTLSVGAMQVQPNVTYKLAVRRVE